MIYKTFQVNNKIINVVLNRKSLFEFKNYQ